MVEWKCINEICGVYDGTHQTPKYTDSGVKFVSVENINAPYDSCKYISEDDFEKNYKTKPEKGDVLMTRIGDVGTCAVLNREEPIAYYVSLALLRPNNKLVHSNYVKYILESNIGKRELRKKTLLTAVPLKINLGDVGKIKLPVPSLSEQNRIVEILDTFTASIDNLKEQIALRRKQYEYYRDQLLDLEGKEGVEMKKLGVIMQIVRGASPRPIQNYITTADDGVNWIKIGDVSPNDKYVTSAKEKITVEGAKKSRLLHPCDFILSNSMSFGRPYILQIEGCIHDGWIAMSNYEEFVSSGYLYEILDAEMTQRYWRKKANNGGAMTNLNSDIVKDTPIPVPPLSEQQRIVDILEKFEESIQNLEAQLAGREKQYEYYKNKLLTFE